MFALPDWCNYLSVFWNMMSCCSTSENISSQTYLNIFWSECEFLTLSQPTLELKHVTHFINDVLLQKSHATFGWEYYHTFMFMLNTNIMAAHSTENVLVISTWNKKGNLFPFSFFFSMGVEYKVRINNAIPTLILYLFFSFQTNQRWRLWWSSLRVWPGKERTWSWRVRPKANPSKTPWRISQTQISCIFTLFESLVQMSVSARQCTFVVNTKVSSYSRN